MSLVAATLAARGLPRPDCGGCGALLSLGEHAVGCPTRDAPATEIAHGVWVGSVDDRADPRFAAVVSVLTASEALYAARSLVPYPPGAWVTIDHPDREPGLGAKVTAAWDFAAAASARGPVLFHCWAGASRSPSVAAGFLRARRGYSVGAAVDAFLRRPPTVDAWLPFLRELL